MLDLPPPYRLIKLRESGDAFSHAISIAAQEGAGTLVHVGRFDLAEFALVLEPDEPLRQARRVFHAGMVALTDALAAHAPPEKPISIDWPGTIRVDGAVIGGGRLAWPADAAEDEVPAWLVFGAMVRTVAMVEGEPGLRPMESALEQEGFEDLESSHLVGSFARHFMRAIDVWRERGFGEVAKDYAARLETDKGVHHEIAENGDLLVRYVTSPWFERRSLADVLAPSSWLDPLGHGSRI